jgi:hypothetical protein
LGVWDLEEVAYFIIFLGRMEYVAHSDEDIYTTNSQSANKCLGVILASQVEERRKQRMNTSGVGTRVVGSVATNNYWCFGFMKGNCSAEEASLKNKRFQCILECKREEEEERLLMHLQSTRPKKEIN